MSTAVASRAGRFELHRVLGRGAQASVWLAHDPKLQRDVAVKVLADGADAAAVSEWLHEAHAVSRLKHPNIVPLFEADDAATPPYLVFEYVEGGTLAERLRRDGAWPARRAVELVCGVLDALAEAHAQGIVHRDLKPSNVLLGADGRPRVMDFGIAARVSHGADGRIVGTAGYLSPEAARAEAPSPRMDVFSAAVVLAELLTGRRLLDERDPLRALERVQHEDLSLPADCGADDALRSIVQRALSRDPARRHDSAATLRDALSAWLDAGAAAAPSPESGHGTLDFLLRRMRHKSDFPALGQSIVRIQRSANSETESLAGLTNEVMRDVALTNKLLRLVNSAQFRHAGGGTIATVSRAVALVGFGGVRNIALSLVLLEHMQNRQHASQMKDEFLRAMLAATLAGELAPLARESEEVYIGALFQNLGRLLTEFYFPEEAQQIRSLHDEGIALDDASARVLGIGLQELGIGVARTWGLPDTLVKVMRTPEGTVPARAVPHGVERMRWLGRCANEVADCLLDHAPDEAEAAVAAIAERDARALGLATRDIVGSAARARVKLADFADLMGVDVASSARARRLFPHAGQASAAHPADAIDVPLGDAPTLLIAAPTRSPEAATHLLTDGITEVTQCLAQGEFRLDDLLRKVMQTMLQAMQLQRIVLCLRDPKTETLTGRLAIGEGAAAACKPFAIALRDRPGAPVDLFAAICRKGADTVISDTTRAGMATRLPGWYAKTLNAPSFLLLPLMMRQAPFGLIYADATTPGALAPQEKELALLRTLRNQVVMAFRQMERA